MPDYSRTTPGQVRHEVEVEVKGEVEVEGEEGEETTGDKSPPPRLLQSLWNEIVGQPQVREFTKGRETKCRLRLRERSPDEWKAVFHKIRDSKFCGGDNNQGWRADFDWIIASADNSAKVLEGKYDDRASGKVPQASPGVQGLLDRIERMKQEKADV